MHNGNFHAVDGVIKGMLPGCIRTMAWVLELVVALTAGCSRDGIEAVNLANEGDEAKNGNIDEAISKYEQAVALDPKNHRILLKLGLAYQKKEEWAKVASTMSKAEKIVPTYANYYFIHGYALRKAAEKGPTSWADAKLPLEQAIAKDPNLFDAYEELAEVMLHMDDEAGALHNYTRAIEVKPNQLSLYAPLADLYSRLNMSAQAEQVLKQALLFGKEGDKGLFAVHSLLGGLEENRGNTSQAIQEYELAKQACGQCMDPLKGEQIAYFNLGGAYASLIPPRKNEAMQQLTTFSKLVCKGGMAQRYADQCAQAQEIAKKMGGSLP